MIGRKLQGALAATILTLGLAALPASAQPAPGGAGGAPGQGGGNGGGGGNNGGGRGNFDPAAMAARRAQFYKDRMGFSDDEYAALAPKIDKVRTLQRDAGGGGGFGGGGRGGRGGAQTADPNATVSPVQTASKDLQTTLDNKDSTADQIKAKLEALRNAKAAAKAELAKAQEELRSLLTQRQEAIGVTIGLLD